MERTNQEVQIGVPHFTTLYRVEECIYNSYKMGIVSVLHGIQSSVFVKQTANVQLLHTVFVQTERCYVIEYTPSLISGMFPGCRTLQSAGSTLRRGMCFSYWTT